MRNKTLLIVFSLVLMLSFCLQVNAQDKIILKFGYAFAVSHNVHIFAEWMKKQLDEKTNGQVELRIFPSGTLGNDPEMVEGVLMGTLDLVPTGGSYGPSYQARDLKMKGGED